MIKRKIIHEIVLISDIHLGSSLCKTGELISFLKRLQTKTLILNGDIFEDLKHTHRLKNEHWKVLEQLREMQKNCLVYFNIGNHDRLYGNKRKDLMAITNLLGIQARYQTLFQIGSKHGISLHGDCWDSYIYKYKTASDILTWCYDRLKESKYKLTKKIIKWIKRKSKILMRNSEFVMSGALSYAKKLECDIVICGHTHHAVLFKKNNIVYGNTGTFESDVPTYITIDPGKVRLWRWENKKSTLLGEEKL